ncbi:phosphatase PAP2 family protein, partial [Sinirhodobacter sp. WL0062]
ARRRWVAALAWAHAVVTGVVVVGTGNHWVLDVVAGWAVVLIAWRTVGPERTAGPTPGEQTVLTPIERDLGAGRSLTRA